MSEPRADPEVPERYGQLTYSSFDSGQGRGGWQVKEARGLSAYEQEQLTARISTRFEGPPTDRFLTAEQIEALPRRLVYAPAAGGHAYWHTVPAGVDGSGRPGNVFAHVLLDRHPEATDELRPIDLWRSPDWLTPYNPDGVVAARLPAITRPRPPNDARDRALRFLQDPEHWRLGVLPGFLDAVAGALGGGRRVVLGVAEHEHASGWIAVASRFMSPGTARRMSFSTLESADSIDDVLGAGAHVVGVRRSELDRLSNRHDLVVIDEEEIIQTGSLGGEPHLTAHGSRVPATPWSGLAQVLLDDPDRAPALLEELDNIAVRVGDRGVPVAWPAAVVVLHHLDELNEGREDAIAAVLADSPPLDDQPELAEVVARGIRKVLTGDAAQMWAQVRAVPTLTASPTSRLITEAYLERALLDSAWLTADRPVPLPEMPEGSTVTVNADLIVGAAHDLRRRASEPAVSQGRLAVECLRMVDLLSRAHALPSASHGSRPADGDVRLLLEVEVERLVLPLLREPRAASALRQAVGPVSPLTVEQLLRPLLAGEVEERRRGGVVLGDRLPGEVVDWLLAPADETGAPPGIREAIERLDGSDALHAEVVLHRHRWAAARADPSWDVSALVAVLHEAAEGRELRRPAPPVPAELAQRVRLTVDELLLLTRRFESLVPPDVSVPVLTGAPLSSDLEEICRRLAFTAWREGIVEPPAVSDSALERLVRLRTAVHGGLWWESTSRPESVRRAVTLYSYAVSAASATPDVELPQEVVCHAQAAWLLAEVSEDTRGRAVPDPLVLGRVLTGPNAAGLVAFLADVLEPPVTAGLAALIAPASPFVELAQLRPLASLRADLAGNVATVLEHVARQHIDKSEDLSALIRRAAEAGRNFARSYGARLDEKATGWDEFAPTYLKALPPKQGVLHATLGRFRRG